MGLASGTVGMPRRRTNVGQIKLASDPESRRIGTWSWVPPHETHAERPGCDAEGGEESVTPIRIPILTDGRCPLLDRWTGRAQLPNSTGTGGGPDVAVARSRKSWFFPPAWVPCRALRWHRVVPCCGYGILPGTGLDPEDDGRHVGRLTGHQRVG